MRCRPFFASLRHQFFGREAILLRHAESTGNKEDRFAAWTDVNFAKRCIEEAKKAGRLLKKEGFSFDVAFTSVLKRAIRTLWIPLDKMDLMWIPDERSWRLNERHYGALQGLNKQNTALAKSRFTSSVEAIMSARRSLQRLIHDTLEMAPVTGVLKRANCRLQNA